MTSSDFLELTCNSCGTRNRVPSERLQDEPICGHCKTKLLTQHPVQADDASFTREVEESPLPVLVDFWAPWCGPCRMIGPILEKIAKSHIGKVKIVKVNVDQTPQTSRRFNIQSIPALKLFKNGSVVDELVGALPEAQLVNWLDSRI